MDLPVPILPPFGPRKPARHAEVRLPEVVTEIEDALLKDQQVHLYNVRGVGYEILAPAHQTKRAEEEGVREMRKALTRLGDRLVNVDHAQLTAEQRRQNVDAQVRFRGLEAMLRQSKRKLPEALRAVEQKTEAGA